MLERLDRQPSVTLTSEFRWAGLSGTIDDVISYLENPDLCLMVLNWYGGLI
ncbi:MAG: hypothetical protein R2758_02210 [Bacteroidales bacterium]